MSTMRVSQPSTTIEGAWRANGHSALVACMLTLHELVEHEHETDYGRRKWAHGHLHVDTSITILARENGDVEFPPHELRMIRS
jgi:hypothetical protein